ncbi:MAG TPA: phosphoribulokinase [Methanoregulaceae archaeon]|nr:phosphoribulokinase [Methanoregulaceae archaeon]HPD10110.1 phosphoribulokinase [Methanoregulaceae archaeon]HRT15116.1 phosphoribulokinase [Methanoregulaceae archaeon]HRU30767.1 phosphoribulokinase [Methanoregulaceae archaeon]
MTGMEERPPFHESCAAKAGMYVIGVAGDSGSGKSTFTATLRNLFGDRLVSTITLDDYHCLDREERRIRNITPLAPEANNLEGLEQDLRLLKAGTPVMKKVYNHKTGKLEGPVEFSPPKILILEGLHTLFTPRLRRLVDFSLYVDPAPDVKREWKVKRDVDKRGYSEQEVMDEIRRRQADYSRYIAPQREYADAVIQIGFSRFGRDLGWTRNIYRITLLQAPAAEPGDDPCLSINLPLLPTVGTRAFSLEYKDKIRGGTVTAAFTIDGEFDQQFLIPFFRSLESETGVDPATVYDGRRFLTPSEVTQLIFCWRVIRDILSPA